MIKLDTIFLFFSISAFLPECVNSYPETRFEKDGVSFVSPGGWEIVEGKQARETGYYVSCQHKSYRSNGIFMVTWINGIVDIDSCIWSFRQELENNLLFKSSNVSFSHPKLSIFNTIECTKVDYKAKILGVDHTGELFSFYCNGKTFTLVFQESVRETERNKSGFEKIKKTFQCTESREAAFCINP